MHTAATIAAEGTAGVEVAELTVYLFVCGFTVLRPIPGKWYLQLSAGRFGRRREKSRDFTPSRVHSANMVRVRVSIVFESGARIGPGKAKLLESIRDTGSISAAAREMGMSYKRAWLLLDSMNQAFTELVVTAASRRRRGRRNVDAVRCRSPRTLSPHSRSGRSYGGR